MSKKQAVQAPEVDPKNWELIYESEKRYVDHLIKIYKENPIHARVIYSQDKDKYRYTRIVKFEKPNGDFQIVKFTVKYGISTSSKIYHRQVKQSAIFYTKKKYWIQNRVHKTLSIIPLCYFNLNSFINFGGGNVNERDLMKYFKDKLFWLKMVIENKDAHAIPFNTIIANKLFGYNDILRYKYKCSAPIAKMLKDSNGLLEQYSAHDRIKVWREVKKNLINIDRLTPELLDNDLFNDTCKMAASLGEKINCVWGEKRLKEAHDEWSAKITKIVADCEPLLILNIKPVYKAFGEYSGYRLLATNREMIAEGIAQKHCVGTYINQVDRGECAIYHVEGFTLQITTLGSWSSEEKKKYLEKYNSERILQNSQFRGRFNNPATAELEKKVADMIENFNLEEVAKYLNPKINEEVKVKGEDEMDTNGFTLQVQEDDNNLPF